MIDTIFSVIKYEIYFQYIISFTKDKSLSGMSPIVNNYAFANVPKKNHEIGEILVHGDTRRRTRPYVLSFFLNYLDSAFANNL